MTDEDRTARQYDFLVEMTDIFWRSLEQASKASFKFPQPNKVLLKVAEEAGEVVKAGVHISEERDFNRDDLEGEVIDTIAMLIRLVCEGDGTIGLPKLSEIPNE